MGERTSSPFSQYMDLALYHPALGFYSRGGRAGRGNDFLTSPEVGPLFGAVLADALDGWWHELGCPDPFVVVEVGAGPGTLARTIRYAAPECSPSLLYVLVETSAFQRSLHGEHLPGWMGERRGFELEAFVSAPQDGAGPQFVSTEEMPRRITGVILANELLDNLPFDILRVRPGGELEQLEVAIAGDDHLEPVVVASPVPPAQLDALGPLPVDSWFPWQAAASEWVGSALECLERGRLVVFDYGAPTAELAGRTELGWLRTFRSQEVGGHPLDLPGLQDITADVAIDQLQLHHTATAISTQAEFLRMHGIEARVAEGRAVWEERAHIADLAAIRGRSAVREAEALLDPSGLGEFMVIEWDRSTTD